MTIRVAFDAEHCAGHALCAAAAPDVFELDDNGYCIPPQAEVSPELVEQAYAGADACPEQAITILDESTAKVGQ